MNNKAISTITACQVFSKPVIKTDPKEAARNNFFAEELARIKEIKNYTPKKALARLNALLNNSYNQTSEVYNLKLELLALLRKTDEAIELFNTICKKELDNEKTYYRFGLIFFYDKNYAKTIQICKNARHQSKDLQMLIYRSLYSAGKLKQAQDFLIKNTDLSEADKLLLDYESALITANQSKKITVLKKLVNHKIFNKPLNSPLKKLTFTDHLFTVCQYRNIDLNLIIKNLETKNFHCLSINNYFNFIYIVQADGLYKIILKRKFCITAFKEIDFNWKTRLFWKINKSLAKVHAIFYREIA